MRLPGAFWTIPAAVVVATAVAPPLLDLPAEAAMAAGAAALALWTSVQAALSRDRNMPWASPMLSAGFLIWGLAGVLPFLPGAPPWLLPGLLFVGAVLTSTGLLATWRARTVTESEAESLRAVLSRREGDVRAQAERIRRLDTFDPASGLLNRRGFSLAAAQALEECASAGAPLVLLLVDLEFGPGEGAVFGPEANRRLGNEVQRTVRGSDAAGRWDRNLLALLLPRCQDPQPAIRRLHTSLAVMEGEGISHYRVAGVAVSPRGPWPDAEGLMAAAQAAMAAARRAPSSADAAIWPIDWGLAAAQQT